MSSGRMTKLRRARLLGYLPGQSGPVDGLRACILGIQAYSAVCGVVAREGWDWILACARMTILGQDWTRFGAGPNVEFPTA